MNETIVVCDDEELIRWSVAEFLKNDGYVVHTAEDGAGCLQAVRDHGPDLVLMDLKMPVMDGLTALRKLREAGTDVPVVVVTAHGGVDSAIEATRLGASAYLQKPFDLREVGLAVRRALEEDRIRQEVHHLRGRQKAGYGEFLGASESLQEVFETLRRLESIDAPTVLIHGESGVGKDVIARAIHAKGPRRDKVFMDIDCASLPEQLIESELFGHERGSFTDARQTKRGLLEVAAGGVVFLDEIGELTPSTQSKLLRALESRTFKRVGGVANLRMDAALLTATNRDLKAEVRAGRFREDLFFRLNVVPIRVPALRERRDDIPLLVGAFLERYNRAFGRDIQGVAGDAMALLQAYSWPGNVRELRNVIERIVILSASAVIGPGDLPPEVRFARGVAVQSAGDCPFVLPEEGVSLEAVERGLLAQALDRTGGNQSAAGRLLGITRFALRYRMQKFGLE